MKPSFALLTAALFLGGFSTSRAADLKQSKLTQVVNDVQIISAANQSQKKAALDDVFNMPDILRTGASSRAELVAEDQTVTRVGANTIFSFDPASRTIDLKQGSLLFHSPHGKGGGSIHTGSATASVLGSTLIVVATPNGGFKVLALEDEAEIQFLNGLKQKLEPGQMTYILPGGNHLAPIIIFRLDSLTQNSLLVNGFNKPLPSLPLIVNQIEKQTKLIKSGKASDTGLYAGDDASSSQVEVLDINSYNHYINSAKTALAADATINQSSLNDASIPVPPHHIFGNIFFNVDRPYFGNRFFRGFAARNIFFNTPAANLSPLFVNMQPYSGISDFDFVAADDMNFEGSVTFAGLSPAQRLFMYAGDQINFSSGITVQANARDFQFSAAKSLSLDAVTIKNALGHLGFNFGEDISVANHSSLQAAGNLTMQAVGNLGIFDSTLEGGSIFLSPLAGALTVDNSTLDSPGHVLFTTANNVTINDSTITSDNFALNGSQVSPVQIDNSSISALTGDFRISGANTIAITGSDLRGDNSVSITGSGVSITGTSIKTALLTLNSGDGILLDASGKSLTGVGSSATANFFAPNLITVNHADFTSFANVNMAANTVNLTDVAFGGGSLVTLKSLNGVLAANPNSGAVSVPGAVNFIQGVTYGGNAAQNYVNNGGGITITTLH